MPPTAPTRHVPRGPSTGTTFPIIFAVVAFLIIAGCVIWGYFIPKWREKYPPRPSSTRYNCLGGGANSSSGFVQPSAPSRFPSHPALLRDCRKQPRVLSQYNPRTQTPFHTSPQTQASVRLSTLWSSTSNMQECTNDVCRNGYWQSHTSPSSRTQSTGGNSQIYFEDIFRTPGTMADTHANMSQVRSLEHGSSADGLLPTTSSLVAKSAGRPPSLTRVVNKFPSPKVLCDSEIAFDLGCGEGHLKAFSQQGSAVTMVKDVYKPAGRGRFRSARKPSLRKRYTPSTEPLNCGASSDLDSVSPSTPPTSPPTRSRTSILLPTALHLRRASVSSPSRSPNPYVLPHKPYPSASEGSSMSRTRHVSFTLQKSLQSKRDARKSLGFYHPNSSTSNSIRKPKPAFLALSRSSGSYLRPHYVPSRSSSTITSALSTVKTPRRLGHSWAGSSSYSQDTNGTRNKQGHYGTGVQLGNWEESASDAQPSPRRANSMEVFGRKVDNWALQTGHGISLISPTTVPRRLSDLGPRGPWAKSYADSLTSPHAQTTNNGLPNICTTSTISAFQAARTNDDVFNDRAARDVADRAKVLKRVLELELAWSETDLAYHSGSATAGGPGWI